LSLISSLCIGIAFILNWCSAAQCNFLNLVSTYGNNTVPDSVSLHFGVWNYEAWTVVSSGSESVIFQGCEYYPEYIEIDSKWKAARAFSVIALLLGVGMIFVELYSVCNIYAKNGRRFSPLTVGGYFACSLCSGLTLLMLGTSDLCKSNELSDQLASLFPNTNMKVSSCDLSTSGKCAIAATVLWWLAAGAASIRASRLDMYNKTSERDSDTNGTTDPLLLGYDEFNTCSTRWLHNTRQ
jgi:hypothetical protein